MREQVPYPNRPPNFRQLNEGSTHAVARHELNTKDVRMAQTELGLGIVERFPVSDDKVGWDVGYPVYDPPFIDMPRGNTSFRKEGDAPDPDDPRQITSFASLEVPQVERDTAGYPLNPIGRTGLGGRFMLDKWGPTQAADPILTRTNPDDGAWEVLLVQRQDTGEWALPGGKVDEGETAAQAAGRELREEAGVSGVELDFSDAAVVYAGYADDSRNSDNAWMETTALHKHLDNEQSRIVQTQAGSDAAAARWVRMAEVLAPDARVFSSHGMLLSQIGQS